MADHAMGNKQQTFIIVTLSVPKSSNRPIGSTKSIIMDLSLTSSAPSPPRPPPPDASEYHPVLQELLTQENVDDPPLSCSTSTTNKRLLGILNYLLVHGVVSAESLRAAHHAVVIASSPSSAGSNVQSTEHSVVEKSCEKAAARVLATRAGKEDPQPESKEAQEEEVLAKQESSSITGSSDDKKKKKNNNNNTKSRHPASRPLARCRRHVALQIYYDGANYSGLAENVGHAADQSVERALFHALVKASFVDPADDIISCNSNNSDTKNINNNNSNGKKNSGVVSSSTIIINTKPMREQCQYSRCGRTDRGVSAAGQVIALTLPSAFAPDASWDEAGQRLVFSRPQDQQRQQQLQQETEGVIGAIPTEEPSNKETLPSNSHDSVQVWVPVKAGKQQGTGPADQHRSESTELQKQQPPRKSKIMTEYPYDYILNNLLPPDIRVLGWTPVSPDFSARFSATTRTYRYFFQSRHVPQQQSQSPHDSVMTGQKEEKDGDDDLSTAAPGERTRTASSSTSNNNNNNMTTSNMNLSAMRQALTYLVGEHDFRNFCKMDVEKVYNFKRIIHSAELVEMNENHNNKDTRSDGGRNATTTVCYFQIVGQAFLWHQIRCIVSVLFMIGRGLEEPAVVRELLNVTKHPGKPSYAMADEAPLVLHHCGYRNLQMGYSVSNLCKLSVQQEGQWQDLVLQAARIRNNLQTLEQHAGVRVADIVSFSVKREEERRKKIQKYGHKSGRRVATTTGSEVNELATMPQPPFASLEFVSWGQAREWLEIYGLIPELYSLHKQDGNTESTLVHVPLLQRAKGTTYEEKVASLQQSSSSSKRRGRYEENIIKKRKTKEEDHAFYDHMTKQGGSAVS
jgi:tRNA pseudouridine(38-40) synthase